MFLTHDGIKLACPFAIVVAVPAVEEPIRVPGLVLLPEQEQRDAFAAQFLIDLRPARHRAQGIRQSRLGGKQRRLNVRIGNGLWQWPG